MKLLIKRIAYKILVISMITVVLSFFSMSSVSEAKLKLKDGEFYYSGTQEGTYVVEKSFWSGLLNALAEIANYLLGIQTLGTRGVIVGYIEIMEIILTAILGVEVDWISFFSDALAGMDSYSQQIVNVETILFNRVPILDANMFKTEQNDSRNSEKVSSETITEGNEVVKIIKESVAKWYYIMRLIVITFMLLLLIFIGIKMAISTISSEKAVYKQMLIDWVAGMIIVFSIHYIMVAILTINDSIVDALSPLAREPAEIQEVYQYGDKSKVKTASEIETTLYESARTRAYSLKLTDGFTGMIIYGVLVYYAWRFALIYFRRVINIIILTLMAPAISASYAFNKVLTGKPKIFSTWLSEYIMNVIIQIVHVLIYVSFVSIALTLTLTSLIGVPLAFALLNFMIKADKLVRQLFKLSGGKGSLAGDMADRTDFKQLKHEAQSMKNTLVGGTLAKTAMKATYGIATKPLRTAGMAALSQTVAAVNNNEHFKKRQEEKKKKKEKELEEDAREFLENDETAIEKNQEIDELEEEKRKLLKKRQLLEAKLESYNQHNYEEQAEEIKKKLEENQNEINNIDKEIKKREEEIQKAFLTQQISSSASIIDTVKENIGAALNELVEEKHGRYKSKKVKTLREGNIKGTIWRKTLDSKTLRFKKNMKLGKLFDLDSSEEKILKSEMDFWKKRITAIGSMVAGFPALAINPLVGMALLSKSGITHLDVKTRRRRYKNRAARIEGKSYTFKTFGGGAVARLSRAESYHILEMDRLEALKHKKVRKEVKNVMKFAKQMEAKENNIRKDVKASEQQYAQGMFDYENDIKKDASNKSTEDLAFEQEVKQKNAVNVGDGICMQLQTNVSMKKFINEVEKITSQKDLSAKDKKNMINKMMSQQKGLIIKEAIATLCAENGITDINELQLTDSDMLQINENILAMLETSGVVRKGDIDLESANINEETISQAYLDLTSDYEETNRGLESNLVSSAILEYMERKGEKDVRNLNTEEAKQEIYDILKDKLMSKSSKDSASVIEKLIGKNKIKEEFELSEEIKEAVEENIKKVRKTTKRRFGKKSRQKNFNKKRSKQTSQSCKK